MKMEIPTRTEIGPLFWTFFLLYSTTVTAMLVVVLRPLFLNIINIVCLQPPKYKRLCAPLQLLLLILVINNWRRCAQVTEVRLFEKDSCTVISMLL